MEGLYDTAGHPFVMMEFIYLVFTHMRGDNFRWQLGSLLLCVSV